jgi:hypothetical protein
LDFYFGGLLTGCRVSVNFLDGYNRLSLAIALQSVLPVSAVLLVAGSLIGVNVLAVLLGAAVLTLKGVHPQEVRWLNWLHGDPDPLHTSVYAACPLTCDLVQ